jgi:hypothetical protein
LSTPQIPAQDSIPISEYVKGKFVPLSHLTHGWEIHSMLTLTPAEERTMVREPAQAVPGGIAERIGPLRVLMVPYIACEESGDVVCPAKPKGATHTAAWVETSERTNLLLACREVDAHDTGFEFLASVAELLRPRLTSPELADYDELLDEELRHGVRGEIDEESLTAKQALLAIRPWRRSRLQYEPYRDISLVSTVAEYMHGLWHDVQIRVGPEHLPLQQLRRRLTLMSNLFPPNPGYAVFAKDLEEEPKKEEGAAQTGDQKPETGK